MGFHEKNLKQDVSADSLGFFIRYHRKKQQLSINSFAEMIGISPSYLSDIEHGNKKISDYTFKKIFRELKIDIHHYTQNYISFSFAEILNAVIHFDLALIKRSYKFLDENFINASFNSSLHLNVLIYYITHLFVEQSNLKIDESTLMDVYYILSEEHKKIMLAFYAYQLEKDNHNQKALDLYHEVVDHYKFVKYPSMEGWLYFRISELSLKNGDIYQSLRYCDFTDRFFKDDFNTKRIMYNSMTKSNVLSILNEYEEAIGLLNHLLRHQMIDEDYKMKNQLIQNMCSIALEHEKYDDLLHFISFIEKSQQALLNMVFYEVYSYIQIGDLKKAKKKLNKCNYLEENNDELINTLLMLCEHVIEKKENLDDDIKQLMKLKEKETNYQNKRFINRILIDYFVKNGNFKTAYELSINVNRKNSNIYI